VRDRAKRRAARRAGRLLARERAAELAAAIAALPSGQRDAVVLFHLADLPQHAVASRLTTGEGAVRTRLHKARTALRARLSAASTPDRSEEDPMPTTARPARIADIRRTPAGRHVALLAVDDREVPIWIGATDAEALAAGLHDVERPRPDPHALALALVRASGRGVDRVRVTRLDGGIFYAEVVLDDGTAVDARPSDALVLAVAADVPIEIDPRCSRRRRPAPRSPTPTATTWPARRRAARRSSRARCARSSRRGPKCRGAARPAEAARPLAFGADRDARRRYGATRTLRDSRSAMAR
jgi:bifunctional DNase/RNase